MQKQVRPALIAGLILAFVVSMPGAAQQRPGGGYYNFYSQRMDFGRAPEPWEALLGKPAPNVRLETMGGGTFDLSSYAGKKVVVMDFWATYCPPCRLLLPGLAEVAKAYKDKDVVFMTINSSDPPEYITRFFDTNGFRLDVALDKEGDAARAYMVNTIPRLVIVGKDGTVQSVHAELQGRSYEEVKQHEKQRLTDELDKLLAGKNLVEAKPAATTMEAKKEAAEK